MALGILSGRSKRGVGASYPQPRIDLGPECVPGYPCSEAAEQRQIFERGLKAFLDRSRNPPSPMEPQSDQRLRDYQDAVQQLSPGYAAELTNQAAAMATLREGTLNRRADLMQSKALHGPYYVIPAPPAMLWDAAWTGARW